MSGVLRRMARGAAAAILGMAGVVSATVWGADPARAEQGFVGLEIQAADGPARAALGFDGFGGVLIRDIHPGGPGQRAGLRRGDLLTAFEGVALTGLEQLVQYMATSRPGQAIAFDVWREGRRETRSLTLGDWPDGWRETPAATAVLPRLGLTLHALTADTRGTFGVRWGLTGVVVGTVEPGGEAERRGLRRGDLVVAVGRQPVTHPARVEAALATAGDDWIMLVDRGNDVRLLGPGAPSADAVVAGEHVLAAGLADGPYVLDTTLGVAAGVARGGAVPALPKPRPLPAAASAQVPEAGLTVAALSAEARGRHAVRWSSQGVVVTGVAPGSAAQLAGLAPGHVIHALNQTPVREPADLARRFAALTASHGLLLGETAHGFRLLSLRRDGASAEAGPTAVQPVFQFGKPPG